LARLYSRSEPQFSTRLLRKGRGEDSYRSAPDALQQSVYSQCADKSTGAASTPKLLSVDPQGPPRPQVNPSAHEDQPGGELMATAAAKTTALHWFILAVMALMIMDFWLNIEQGFGVAEAIIRTFAPLLVKGGR